MYFEEARRFLYRNARPLDLARWRFHFENGSREEVLALLAAYQNPDGGFAHALEPDCWNPNSSPVQTWCATEILRELGPTDKAHPIVQGILHYLSLGTDFDGHVWANCVPTNNDFPHAPWWTFAPGAPVSYNPTASLAGFILHFAESDTPLYAWACAIAGEAYTWFEANAPLESFHTAACFVELYEYVKDTPAAALFDMAAFRALLTRQLAASVTADEAAWKTEYVCKPSLFIHDKSSDFYPSLAAVCETECRFLRAAQAPDGTWPLTLAWGAYPAQWAVSENWWKADLILKNTRFLEAMRG